ncbi:pseudouridine synthase [Mangrovimicrobium sediminis]|uniref:Pseudouridine synthase n=1 Tax=Mangrovimicrobium sediminis TaxID=2562682 RepID=A0A4Z0M7A5_9GAMM|nr:pseudouridine synthase [Haliea sp. SAOS-164]TGD75277.1 pseudouridine synthase [Haliea sp. SAOS-164]
MAELLLFNKPFQVLSQFTDSDGRATLADYLDAPGFRAAGRLDYDSEGLLLLTDDGGLQQRIANPRHKLWKTYRVQVEGVIDAAALASLERGLELSDGPTLPARARRIEPPTLWPRQPPVRTRKTVPDSWLELAIREGRNRQVRRMTAAAGFPTLRLVRWAVGDWTLDGLQPGEHRRVFVHERGQSPFSSPHAGRKKGSDPGASRARRRKGSAPGRGHRR